MVKINGYLIQAYVICPRQLWFHSRRIISYQGNDLLEIGRMIHEGSYKREKKEIDFGNFKIDVLKRGKNGLVIAEVKKSSKAMEAARMQLLFYLYELKKMGMEARGELLIPKEKRKEQVFLTAKSEEEIKNLVSQILKVIKSESPPPFKKIAFCNKCAYRDFCFA